VPRRRLARLLLMVRFCFIHPPRHYPAQRDHIVNPAKIVLSRQALNPALIARLKQLAGTSIRNCMQCGKCSAGCPMAGFMEHPPSRTLRLLQLGQNIQVLAGRSIWHCASCETCTTRCPNGVDPAAIMDALRKLWWDEQGRSEEKEVQLASRLFLDNIRRYGRQHEMRLGALFNLQSGKLFKDLALGPKLMARGKLKLTQEKNRNLAEIEQIFARIEQMRQKGKTP
jgi:heterodisulfide reductase subunit C2